MRAVGHFLTALFAVLLVAGPYALLAACFTPKTARICVEVAAVRDAGADAR